MIISLYAIIYWNCAHREKYEHLITPISLNHSGLAAVLSPILVYPFISSFVKEDLLNNNLYR